MNDKYFAHLATARHAKPHSKVHRLTMQALSAAVEDNWEKAVGYVGRLISECGNEGFFGAVVGWCQAVVLHAHDGVLRPFGPRQANVGLVNYDTGSHMDEAPPEIRWAAKLIQAYANDDKAEFVRLIGRFAELEMGRRADHVSALLTSAALTIRSLPAGYALIGRTK